MTHAHPIIAVCGPPGSGKSTFATALAKEIDAVVVDMDHYQTFTDQSLDEVIANLSETTSTENFYASFEVPQLSEDLQQLRQGLSVTIPSQKGSQPLQTTSAIIFETHFGRAHPNTGQLIDFLIWLDCPLDIAMARKLGSFLDEFLSNHISSQHRDQITWLNRYVQQYQTGVRTTLDIQSRTIPPQADFRLEANQSIEDMVDKTLHALQQWRQHDSAQSESPAHNSAAYDYLSVEPFCHDFVQLQLIGSGIETGLFDALETGSKTYTQLLKCCDTDTAGLHFLLDSLKHHKVITCDDTANPNGANDGSYSSYQFTQAFAHAYRFKDLLQAKIEFSNFLAPDLLQHMDSFLRNEHQFMASSRLFELFDYQRALELSEENYHFTKRWMDLTTALTRYEAGVCIAHHDFGPYQRIMDIGGNSGEFVRQICEAHPHIQATVVDLPVVCEVGRDHLSTTAQAAAVEFYPANALLDPLPGHQCAISFKSILHDWPIEACERFIVQASKALRKGGELIIFERGSLDLERYPMTYGTLSTAMFYRSYRDAEEYRPLLEAAGLSTISIEQLALETDFHLIRARKA